MARPIDVKLVGGHFVTILPPGAALHSSYIANHGRSDIFVEITVWPKQEHRGQMTTGAPWRSVDDRVEIETSMIAKLEAPSEADKIRMAWLGRQRFALLDVDHQARRILAWMKRPVFNILGGRRPKKRNLWSELDHKLADVDYRIFFKPTKKRRKKNDVSTS